MSFNFDIGTTGKAIVTVTAKGFAFNRNALEMIGYPKYTAIGLDETTKKIAFRPLETKTYTEPTYEFGLSSYRRKFVSLVAAPEVLVEVQKLIPNIIDTSFVLERDNDTGYYVIDLSTQITPYISANTPSLKEYK